MRSTTRMALIAGALLLAGGIGAGVALAAGGGGRVAPGEAEVIATGPEGGTPAQAPYARMSVLVNGNGPAIVRGVGVLSVTNPLEGVFCIKPLAGSGIAIGRAIPIVTTEYLYTSSAATFAQWRSTRESCPAGTFEVKTYDNGVPTNFVGFTITVP